MHAHDAHQSRHLRSADSLLIHQLPSSRTRLPEELTLRSGHLRTVTETDLTVAADLTVADGIALPDNTLNFKPRLAQHTEVCVMT